MVGSQLGGVTVGKQRQGKPTRYITNAKINSAFFLYAVGKSSVLACLVGVKAGRIHLCQVAANTV